MGPQDRDRSKLRPQIVIFAVVAMLSNSHVAALDEICTSAGDCSTTTNAVCDIPTGASDGLCKCDSGYFTDNQACSKRDIDESCGDVSQCEDDNTICDATCKCTATHYAANGTCVQKKDIDETCVDVSQCEDDNTICDTTCKCSATHYAVSGTCVQKKDIEESCDDVSQCEDDNTICDTTCKCSATHYAVSGTCVQRVQLGDTGCSSSIVESCLDENAVCSNNHCICGDDYYDDNGSNTEGTCVTLDHLKVTGMNFPPADIQKNGFKVSWKAPSGYESHVSGYSVSWAPSTAESPQEAGNSTQASITGLEPGRKYTVNIISRNDVTAASSRTVSSTKEQSTEPSQPGPIIATQSELDASDRSIQIYWNHADGVAGSYLITVKDGSDVKANDTVSSASAIVAFEDMKNGYSYSITIIAISQVFERSLTVAGDPYHTTIKTDVQTPSAPGNASCGTMNKFDVTLSLTAPVAPNGDLKQYRIEVLKDQNVKVKTVNTTTPVAAFSVTDLEPGTDYHFRVYTENELYLSTEYATTECKTMDRDAQVGEMCNPSKTGECSNSTVTACLPHDSSSTFCTCTSDHFDVNGLLIGGSCESVSNLKVSDVMFSGITTKGFTVSWTPPSGYKSHVSGYSVSWSPSTLGSPLDTGNKTSAQITGLTPGQTYYVNVTSRNDVTQASVSRTYTVSQQQATKPSTPGPIDLQGSELDADDRGIRINWSGGTGYASSYSVRVLDGNIEKDSESASSTSANISFSDMKHGYTYNIVIIAKSQKYQGSKMEESEPYSGQIKTVVKNPSEPRNFTCSQRGKFEITLIWNEPESPNGDLKGYKIDVFNKGNSKTVQTVEISSPTRSGTISGLQPVTDYEFKIYTKNENYTSNASAVTECATMDRDAPLGGICTPNKTGQCSDTAAKCLSNTTDSICTCGSNYYDTNGFEMKGSCNLVSKLKVSAITFSSITTEGFTVSWTPPSGYESHVSGYSVSWLPNTTGSSQDNGNTTSADITGLTPGQKFTVTIESRNTVTQVSSIRSISEEKEQSAKPGTPGPLNLSSSDLRADDKSIYLVWSSSSGEVSNYTVEVFDGVDKKTTTHAVSAAVVVSFPDMKNGYRYIVSIVAKSQVYDSNKTEDSARYKEQIKTVVTRPTEPRNPNCKERMDVDIRLEWVDPEFPNGDLAQYRIEVYDNKDASKTVVTGSPVNEFEINMLEPGTYYRFLIYTENEDFTSTKYATTECKTLDKMSDQPNSLAVSNITSRSMAISWTSPTESYGEILGYVVQLRDKNDGCHKQIILQCTDCTGKLNITALQDICPPTVSKTYNKSKGELSGKQEVTVSKLLPYFNYTVFVGAVNLVGKGRMASDSRQTLEEAPEKPLNVTIKDIGTNSFTVIWTKGSVKPGITNYTVMVKTSRPDLEKLETIQGYENERYVVKGLEEYWNYTIQVVAATSVGSAESDLSESIRTSPRAPGPVDDLKIITGDDAAAGGTYQTLIVQWKIPTVLERNSEITSYKFIFNDTTENITTRSLNAEGENEDFVYNETINVVPETYYTIQVLAVNHMNVSGHIEIKQIKAPAGVPENEIEKSGKKVIKAEKVSSTQNQLTVPIMLSFYQNLRTGKLVEDGLVVYAEEKDNYSGTQSTTLGLDEFRNMDKYSKATENGFPPYRPVKSVIALHLARVRRDTEEAEQFHFQLGDEDCSAVPEGGFCNGPLAADTGYQIRLVVCTNGGCLVSQEYGPFYTQPIPPEESSIGAIVGGVVGGMVAAGMVLGAIGVILYIRRRQKKGDGCSPIDPTPLHPDIVRKRPVRLDMFAEHLARLHKDSNLLFTAEYDDLKTLSPSHSTTAADDEENRLKNRYINILPFDQTRVKLLQKTDDDSDFINANYLPGYKSPREYIGCQGPIPATVDDFWKMVWEQNVAVIVILTLCKEGNKVKCEQYWPDEVADPKQYGDIVVEVKTLSNIKTYDYRIMRLTYANCTKTVKHFHFLSWLDFQANITHDTILDFITQVRSHVQPPDTAGPTIVHCSAGVGRTGTYICLDHLMQFIQDHDFSTEVDIFDMVLKLRENRPHMVQTEQQYVFIHDCLNEMLERKIQAMREADNIYVNQGFNQEEDLYQNTAMSDNPYQNVTISGGQPLQNTEL